MTNRPEVRATEAIALPVARTTIRPSRTGRWRAAVLLLVHLLIAVHVAHWVSGNETITPLEPSEAMQFTQSGIVNAGLIFFALAILSTALLGRWFCGWGCHVVAIQDATLWLLARVGIRPRPIRSHLLATVPLLAFLYMFISPLLFGQGPGTRGVSYELTTSEFWRTFPTWVPALLTFLTVGVLAIYLLGAKGFCTNGCPYGGIFGLADRVSPYRIRVTDDCTRCGHCTAVCTSNVRVHQEVHDFGMVVDPGCMKCLDCVSTCPNDALYYGRKATRPPRVTARGDGPPIADRVLVFAFATLTLLAMLAFDRAYLFAPTDLLVAALLAAVTVLLTWAAATPSSGGRPLSRGEEIATGGAFVVGLIVLRGLFGAVAFLFALGLAAVVAYACLLAFRLVRSRAVAIHQWVLKRDGRLRPAGFAAVATLVLASGGLAAAAQTRWHEVSDQRRFARAADVADEAGHLMDRVEAGQATRADLERLPGLLSELIVLRPGDPDPALDLGVVRARTGDLHAAREIMRAAVDRMPDEPRLWTNLALFEAEAGALPRGIEALDRAVALTPGEPQPRHLRARMAFVAQRWAVAAEDLRWLIEHGEGDPSLRQMLDACVERLGDN